jgi:hypothetical protein
MKKIIVRCPIFLLILLIIPACLCAQEKKDSLLLTGIVQADSSQTAIPFATLQLTTNKGAVLSTTFSDTDGSFVLYTKKSADSCNLLISSTGYHSKKIIVPVTDLDTIRLDVISLTATGADLQSIRVISRKPLIKQLPGMLEYNLEADPDSKVKNLLDMLKKMPYLSADANDNLLYKGSGNYRIFINGKPSGMMENNARELLKNIPASAVQRIEIITNPSARYDADASGGIINIVMAKKLSDGYSGNLNLNNRFPSGGPGIGGSVSAKAVRWGISAFSGTYRGKNPSTQFINNQQNDASLLSQKGNHSSAYRGNYIGTNISFEKDSLHLIYFQFNMNNNRNRTNGEQEILQTDPGGIQQQQLLLNNGNSRSNGMDAAINYQLGFARKKNKLLTFSYKYLQYNNNINSSILLEDRLSNDSLLYAQANDNGNREHSLQADWVQQLKNISLEAGIKGIFRKNKSLFPTDSAGQMNTQKFVNRQNIIGAYSSFRFVLNSWNVQAGMRIEQTFTDIDFPATQTNVAQQYINLIPNLSVNRSWKQGHGVGFGFSQRIKRPGVNRLNPFTDRSNPYFISVGNPFLKAVVNNDIMMNYSYQKKIFLNLGLSYSFSNKIDLKVVTYDPASNITQTSFENSSKAKRLGLDYTLNYPFNPNLNISLNGYAAYFFIEGMAGGFLINNDMFTYNTSLNSNYRLPKKWNIGLSLEAHGKSPAGLQNFTNGFVSSSFNTSKSFLKDKLNLSVFINNPFAKYRTIKTITSGQNFIQTELSDVYFRTLGGSISYKFGKGREAVKSTKRTIKNNDVAN